MNSIIPPSLDLSALTVEQMTLLQQEIEKHKAIARQREIETIKVTISKTLNDSGLSVLDLPTLFPTLTRPARSKRGRKSSFNLKSQ